MYFHQLKKNQEITVRISAANMNLECVVMYN